MLTPRATVISRALAFGRDAHLGDLTAILARRYGDRLAIDTSAVVAGSPTTRWTYRALEDAVGRWATALATLGVRPGEPVLVALGNRVDLLVHVFALARLGAVAVPVNPRLRPGELAAVALAAAPRRVIRDADLGVAALGDLPNLDVTGPEFLAAVAAATPTPPRHGASRDVVMNLCTSGTTGVPKAAALTSRGLLATAAALRVPCGARHALLVALPLYHVMGLSAVLHSLCAGVAVVHRPRFVASEVLDLLEAGAADAFVGVPTMYADLEAAGAFDRDLRHVRVWLSSADAMPLDRARRFRAAGALVRCGGRAVLSAAFFDLYGMVELSGPAALRALLPLPPWLAAHRALARVPVPAIALPGVSVRAVSVDGRPLAAGRSGELQFRGRGVLERYEGRPDAGADAAGWFGSGDQGRVALGGLFLFAGRGGDRLKVGGFSVFPAEVEAALGPYPDVAELVVVGVPDARLGERLVAVIVTQPGCTVDADALLAWAEGRVASYRRPRAVVAVAKLPRGPNGKLDRARATALAVAGLAGAS